MQLADPPRPPVDLGGGELRAENRVGVATLRCDVAGEHRFNLLAPLSGDVGGLAAALTYIAAQPAGEPKFCFRRTVES